MSNVSEQRCCRITTMNFSFIFVLFAMLVVAFVGASPLMGLKGQEKGRNCNGRGNTSKYNLNFECRIVIFNKMSKILMKCTFRTDFISSG